MMVNIEMMMMVVMVIMVMIAPASSTTNNNSTTTSTTTAPPVATTTPPAGGGGRPSGLLVITPDNKLRFPHNSVFQIVPTYITQDPCLAPFITTISSPTIVNLDDVGLTTTKAPVTVMEPGQHAKNARKLLYKSLEKWADMNGLDGKACLLRYICASAYHPFTGFGLMGEFMQLFLSPSRSGEKGLKKYLRAEEAGRAKKKNSCQKYMAKCPYTFT